MHIVYLSLAAAIAVITLLLWKSRSYRVPNNYNNIVGQTAYVGSGGLTKTVPGEVTWAGTIMRAELAGNAHDDTIEGGSQVTIMEVAGNTLIVKPKI